MSHPYSTLSTKKAAPAAPRPSSSVVLLSPENNVLLLHRVQTSTSFASAHVFPGGNLDAFHDGELSSGGGGNEGDISTSRHEDGPAYRMAAVRECFEETGILLARRRDDESRLVSVGAAEREAARKRVHGNQVRFGEWLESVGGVPDTANLIPFTRWITPANVPKRFTTQMYLYLLPLSEDSGSGSSGSSDAADEPPSEMLIPTPDGGVEHTAATFAPAATFLARADAGDIILFPPQAFLLTLAARFLTPDYAASYANQREGLLQFIRTLPTADTPRGRDHAVSRIPWGDKCISPTTLFVRASDGRVVLGLDKPGRELRGSHRGGDWERVVLVRFGRRGPTEVEVRLRDEVFEEERQAKKAGETKL